MCAAPDPRLIERLTHMTGQSSYPAEQDNVRTLRIVALVMIHAIAAAIVIVSLS